MHLPMILAQAVQSTGVPPSPLGSLGGMLLPIAVIVLIFYLLLFRPQKKQEKAHQEMLKGLKKGDKVVTIGGIHGVVQNVRETDVTLKVDEKGEIRVRFSRSAISRVLDKEEDDSESKSSEA